MESDSSASNLSPFYLNNYYSKISHLTFKTIFIPLSPEEQNVILSFQKAKYQKTHIFKSEEAILLHQLENKIDQALIDFNSPTGVYVKLNFRSPKDGFPLRNDLIPQIFNEEFNKLNEKWDRKLWKLPITEEDYVGNLKWISLYRTLEILACCKNSKEILNLLLSSVRIEEDLQYILKVKEQGYLVLREFNPEINGLYEFRCFIKDNELKSITQYNHPWLVQELLNEEFCEEVKEKILKYWLENVKKTIEYLKDYVMDLALIGKGELLLIELNPIDTSGTGLFKGSEAISSHSLVFKVRNNLEIPYKEHWEDYLQYMMVDFCAHKPYTEFLESQEK